ncbi:MFS transporter [Rhodococcus sp. ARC_M5]|nr:MFS transporter [Rhodococcus sp. ARC_M5]
MTHQHVVNSGPRLDRLPISSFHWSMLGLIGAGAFIDAFDIYLAGGVIAAMADEGFSTIDQNAIFMSATFVGMMVGAAAGGLVGDRWGRKVAYQYNLLIFGLASLAAAFAPNIEFLISMRLIMGLGLGAELVVAMGMLGEFVPPERRGRWAAMLSTVIATGLPVASVVGLFVIPNLGWRYMFGIAGVAAMAVWVARKNMPESPRWLEAQGRHEEAEEVIASIEKRVAASHGPLPPVRSDQHLTQKRTQSRTPLSALFARGVRSRLFVASLLIVTINVTVYGFVSWIPTFLVNQGMSITGSLAFTTAMSVGALVGSLVCVVLADKVSRTKGLIFSCAAIIVFGITFAFAREDIFVIGLGFALVTAVYFFVSLGQFGYTPELFPTRLRLRGTGFASMSGRAAAIAMPFITVALVKYWGPEAVIALVVLLILALMVGLLAFKVDTVKQSLEDIHKAPLPTETALPTKATDKSSRLQ